MDLEFVALDFYDRNCATCSQRKPVGLPNLMELVGKRDRDRTRREAEEARWRSAEAANLAARRAKREARKEGTTEAQRGLYDCIERLDESERSGDGDVLVQLVQTVPDHFDNALIESLFELSDAGGWERTDGALRSLCGLHADPKRLCACALTALARHGPTDTACSIVSDSVGPEHRDLIETALPSIIHWASPSRMIGFSDREGDPQTLLAVFREFPHLVRVSLSRLLASPEKRIRIEACEALLCVIEVSPSTGLELAPALISSLPLSDDEYEGGSAADAVARVLAAAMHRFPNQVDQLVQEAMRTIADEYSRAALFRVYVLFLDETWHQSRKRTDADPIAFHRILEVLFKKKTDECLQTCAEFLCYQAKSFPDLLAAETDTLLGAAVLLAEQAAEKYSPILDPRPSVQRQLEEELRLYIVRTFWTSWQWI